MDRTLCDLERVGAMEQVVVIVGAGPAGLALAACLTSHSIPYLILEREDCSASLWKKRTYDRCCLHLAKSFCELPLMKFPSEYPMFMPKRDLIQYLDSYAAKFKINPLFNRSVESASYDEVGGKWKIEARNMVTDETETYVAEFLISATGENSDPFIPNLPGLTDFEGEMVHSNVYKSGNPYKGKEVLVVGCGNSGMEISYDLFNSGARPSVVIRDSFHVLTKEMVYVGMKLQKHFRVCWVDSLIVMVSRIYYGNLSQFGIHRPAMGPFQWKNLTGKTPVIDVGAVGKIQDGEIKVFPEIVNVKGKNVWFKNGEKKCFDAMVFATGYRSATNGWLKDYQCVLNEAGMPKNGWKGEKGLYFAGLSRMGLAGVAKDAKDITDDIANQIITSSSSSRNKVKFL